MAIYFVCRHAATKQIGRELLPEAVQLDSLDLSMIRSGDMVYGVLPVDLAAEVCAVGARFFAVVYDRDLLLRGVEIADPATMRARGVRLEEFVVTRPSRA